MVDMAYRAGGLEDGAAGHAEVSEIADRAVTVLSQLPVGPGVFGTVATAAVFAESLDRARLGHGRRMAAEVTARSELSQRTSATAGLGLALIGETAAQAGPVDPDFTPGGILAGMGG